jgi:transcriptional regulator with XRE-family HTH domain
MIYVYQILKQIRKNNKYKRSAVAGRMGLTDARLAKLESEWRHIQRELPSWLDHLDVPKQDHEWFFQQHDREKIYQVIRPVCPDPDLALRLSDCIALPVNEQLIKNTILKSTLHILKVQPRQVENVIEELTNARGIHT